MGFKEEKHWYLGVLDIKGSFEHNTNLSGKKVSGIVNHNSVVFALRKTNIKEGESNFWALWESA